MSKLNAVGFKPRTLHFPMGARSESFTTKIHHDNMAAIGIVSAKSCHSN